MLIHVENLFRFKVDFIFYEFQKDISNAPNLKSKSKSLVASYSFEVLPHDLRSSPIVSEVQ